jgi:integrase
VKLLIEVTPELREILDRCRAIGKVKGMYLIHKTKGQFFTDSGIHSAWARACRRAGVENAHIHDLKAKALTDIDDADEAQKLGGHSRPEMTAHYRKAREVTRVKPAPGRAKS